MGDVQETSHFKNNVGNNIKLLRMKNAQSRQRTYSPNNLFLLTISEGNMSGGCLLIIRTFSHVLIFTRFILGVQSAIDCDYL
jgi:hypothetical protein